MYVIAVTHVNQSVGMWDVCGTSKHDSDSPEAPIFQGLPVHMWLANTLMGCAPLD